MLGERIEFEISDSCSSGLMSSLAARGLHEQKSFALNIEKGPILLFLETIIPNLVCLFHIGCSSDMRPPSFEYTLKYGDIRHELFIFSYQRTIYPGFFGSQNWFHDCNELRDLEAVARALSNPENYLEKISLSYSGEGDDRGLCQTIRLDLHFENNQLISMRGLDEVHLLRKILKGFDKSLLDIEEGPLKIDKDIFLNDLSAKEWDKMFRKKGLTVYDFVKEIYDIFQSSAPSFGQKRKVREALF